MDRRLLGVGCGVAGRLLSGFLLTFDHLAFIVLVTRNFRVTKELAKKVLFVSVIFSAVTILKAVMLARVCLAAAKTHFLAEVVLACVIGIRVFGKLLFFGWISLLVGAKRLLGGRFEFVTGGGVG